MIDNTEFPVFNSTDPQFPYGMPSFIVKDRLSYGVLALHLDTMPWNFTNVLHEMGITSAKEANRTKRNKPKSGSRRRIRKHKFTSKVYAKENLLHENRQHSLTSSTPQGKVVRKRSRQQRR